MTLTAAAWRYLQSGGEPKDFAVSAAIELPAQATVSEVERSLNAIVHRHDALRGRYIGTPTPMCLVDNHSQIPAAPTGTVDLRTTSNDWDLRDESIDAGVEAEVLENRNRLAPACGRQIAAAFAGTSNGSTLLLLTVHHLAVDGVSWNVVLRELDLELNRGVDIRSPKVSCLQWVEKMKGLPPRTTSTVEYWRDLTVDPGMPGVSRDDAIVLSGSIAGPAAVAVMRILPRRVGAAPADVMLAAFGIAVRRVLGCSPTILVQGHGRYPNLFNNAFDVTGTVGWLADDYPVRIMDAGTPQNALRSAVADLPDSPEDFTLCSFYCDETAHEFHGMPTPRIYFNYWGHTSRRLGQLTIPDLALNRMEIGNADIADIALQVRALTNSDRLEIEWILNTRLEPHAACAIIEHWAALLSAEPDQPRVPRPHDHESYAATRRMNQLLRGEQRQEAGGPPGREYVSRLSN